MKVNKLSYSDHMRKMFPGIELVPEDLLLLESFQVKYLPDRVPKKEFAALLKANPVIKRFLIAKFPPVKEFIKDIFSEIKPVSDSEIINSYSREALWEIADLIIYNKHPEVYDDRVRFNWEITEIISPDELKGKTVLDVGSGTGQLAFILAPYAEIIYAVEPIPGLRQLIRGKVQEKKLKNFFVVDGFLDALPFPESSVDVLMTSNAIGWNIEGELNEIERVVIQGGKAIHLMRTVGNKDKHPDHELLVSAEWGYTFTSIDNNNGMKFKYLKTIL